MYKQGVLLSLSHLAIWLDRANTDTPREQQRQNDNDDGLIRLQHGAAIIVLRLQALFYHVQWPLLLSGQCYRTLGQSEVFSIKQL